MKKKLNLLFVLLLFSTFLSAQTTPIPDANFEAFLIAQGVDTNGTTGNILNSDAAGVTALNVNVNNITNFSGLQAFVNLVTLNLNGNQFATLPLTTLVDLEELRFNGNMILANLNLSANTKLRVFIARANGSINTAPITAINLSANTLLEDIDIYNFRNLANVTYPNTNTVRRIYMLLHANITVDFSGYDNLENLFLSTNFNNTFAINATLPNDQNHLKSVSCQGGNIVNVNVSNFLVLERLSLQSTNTETIQLPRTNTLRDIRISGHKINTISFENAPMLEILEINYKDGTSPTHTQIDITKNTQLKKFDANSNYMTSINVTQNTLLTDLDVSNNRLTVLDVTKNTVLKDLDASRNQLPTINLAQNTLLERLNLSNNQLPNLNVTQNIGLTQLIINNNLFTGTGLDLTQNVNLNYLNASYNQIASLNISQNRFLRNLILNHNRFSGTSIMDQYHAIQLAGGGLGYGQLDVSYNLLSGTIPDFASIINYSYTRDFDLIFNDNFFHFGDFENRHAAYVAALTTRPTTSNWSFIFDKYLYAPQAKVNQVETLTPASGSDLVLTTTVRGSQNHYRWYKDGVAIPDAPDSPNYTLYNVTDCDRGVYHSEIRSDLVPFENSNPPGTGGKNLLLIRNNITVNVQGISKTCSNMVNPANNATAVPISTGLQWQNNLGACGYRLSVGTNVAANNILNNVDVGKTNVYNFANNLTPSTTYYVRVVPYFSDGPLATACTIQRFTTGTTSVVPSCSQLTVPTSASSNVPVSAYLEWTAANGADGYRLSVGTSPGGTNIVNNLNIGGGNSTVYDFPSNLPYNTLIHVTITPYNSVGSATGCARTSFTTEAAPVVVVPVPSCTTVTSPANGGTNISTSANITWSSVTGATGYYVTIGTTASGSELVNNANVTGTTSYNPSSDFPAGTTIYVSVIPYNATGSATGCTRTSFTTAAPVVPVPSCTTVTSPANGGTNISTSANITWSSVTGATGYYVTIGTTANGSELVNNANVTGTTSYNPSSDFPAGTTIYVSVIPYNATGSATGCTRTSFTTAAPVVPVPSCTTVTSPASGGTNISTSANITWSSVTGATGYYVTIGTTANGSELVNNANVTGTTSYNPSSDFPAGTTIYVSVIPYNATGSATGCTRTSFTTAAPVVPVPSCTTVTSPASGGTNISTSANITWSSVTGATGYYVTIGTTANGSELVNNANVTGTTSYNPSSDFPAGTTIYVSVIPYNATGSATGCTRTSFTTAAPVVPVPSCTTVTSPANGGTNISTSANITWSSVTGATGYYVTIGTTANGSELVNNANVTGTTSYNPSSDFPAGTTIYVSVIPYNATGSATGCARTSFTTAAPVVPVPSCTTVTSPASGGTNISTSANITWSSVTGATGYYVTIGTTASGSELVNNANVTGTTSYNPSSDFPAGTTIYVSVIPYNATGSATGCTRTSFTTEETNVIEETKYGFSPNDDGINDFWTIGGIENYPNNIVSIYNRWGDLVFQIQGYDNQSNVFSGAANKLTNLGGGRLPSGTYFFQIENLPENHQLKKTKGFLVLKR